MGVIHMSDLKNKVLPSVERKSTMITMQQVGDRGVIQARQVMYSGNRKVLDALKPGLWKGERCFIIAGGESVNDFDIERLEGEHVIAVNLAFRLLDPEIIYATDARLWGWIERGETGVLDSERFENSKALKVWSDLNSAPLPEDIVIAPAFAGGKISDSLEKGIAPGTNSGFGALNLAMLLGASEIYLIGFDFYGGRWHAGYPEPSEAGNSDHLQCFKENSEEFKQFMEANEIKIINLNPKSKLKVFEFGEMPKDIKDKKGKKDKKGASDNLSTPIVREGKSKDDPVFVNYFTAGTPYKQLSANLVKSLQHWDLEYDVQPIRDRGTWDANTKFKPEFILKMLDKYKGRNVVWIDSDAIVAGLPELLLKCKADFACHILQKHEELISNIMFFKNNKRSRELLELAIQLISTGEVRPYGEQKFIEEAFKLVSKKKTFKFEALPEEYCWMVGNSSADIKPVIEQHQASRRHRK